MRYQQAKDDQNQIRTNVITRITEEGIVSAVPNDPNNSDWRAYQDWLSQGNTPEPAGD